MLFYCIFASLLLIVDVASQKCNIAKAPYLVSIVTGQNDSHFGTCSGVLLNMEWILTAAHCVNYNQIVQTKVHASAGFDHPLGYNANLTNTSIDELKQIRPVVAGSRYFQFKSTILRETRYDLGLLRVAPRFKQSQLIQAVHLPTKIGYSDNCKTATLFGWGTTRNVRAKRGALALRTNVSLNCVDLSIISLKECKKVINPRDFWIDESVICTKEQSGGINTCAGDQGGPLICGSTIIGISSAGFDCDKGGSVGLFTRVEMYYTFLKDHVGLHLPFTSRPSYLKPIEDYIDSVSPAGKKEHFVLVWLLFIALFGIVFNL